MRPTPKSSLLSRDMQRRRSVDEARRTMNIVIVDDVPINRKLLRACFEADGHTTLEASDGVDALQMLACETVDAVLSDILMPRMDGYRLCHEIRSNERLRDLPIVIYTATYTSPGDEQLA